MRLNKEAIKEFKEVYFKEFEDRITDKKAQELGENLLSLFEIIYRPIPKADRLKDSNKK
jgi:hypothetical protein